MSGLRLPGLVFFPAWRKLAATEKGGLWLLKERRRDHQWRDGNPESRVFAFQGGTAGTRVAPEWA